MAIAGVNASKASAFACSITGLTLEQWGQCEVNGWSGTARGLVNYAVSQLPSTSYHVVAAGTTTGALAGDKLAQAIACQAEGVGPFVSINIVSCYTTNGASAPARALPGTVAATAGAGFTSLQGYSVCVRAIGTVVDGSTRDTGLQCTAAVGSGAGGGGTVLATA